MGTSLYNAASGFNAVEVGHLNIHQHHIGLQLLGQRDGLLTVAGFAHHCRFRSRTKDRPQTVAEERMVIGNEDLNRFAHAPTSRQRL